MSTLLACFYPKSGGDKFGKMCDQLIWFALQHPPPNNVNLSCRNLPNLISSPFILEFINCGFYAGTASSFRLHSWQKFCKRWEEIDSNGFLSQTFTVV